MSAEALNLAELLRRKDLWRGGDHAPQQETTPGIASGQPLLDAELPGGGWPRGALTELLSDQAGIGELSLLLPALGQLARAGEWLVWVAPPHLPYAPALVQHGIPLEHLLLIYTDKNEEQLWAMEQALRAGCCGAVVGWPGPLTPRQLRRLQLAAEQGNTLGILFRPLRHAGESSPAALRLRLEPQSNGLRLHILKRRGGVSRRPVDLTTPLRHAG